MQDVKIIFENENFICVDKPHGLVVHSDGRTDEKSLADWVKEYSEKNNLDLENVGNPHTLDSGRYTLRFGVVNRLDRDTSGLILIAKNQKTFLELQNLFGVGKSSPEGGGFRRGPGIIKKYEALVWGLVDFQEKIVNQKITRHKKDPRIWTCGFTAQEGGRLTGVEAETVLRVDYPHQLSLRHKCALTLVKGERSASVQTKLILIPKTGRTHQLRLHCRFIGHPIVGDDKYGLNGKINEHSTRQVENLMTSENLEIDRNSRLMLHAESLKFELFGQEYFFESKADF